MDFVWNVCNAGSRVMLPLACCCHLHVVAARFSELRHIKVSIMIIRLVISIMMIIILISSGRCCQLHVLLPRRWCCHRWDKVTPHRHSWRDKMDSCFFLLLYFHFNTRQTVHCLTGWQDLAGFRRGQKWPWNLSSSAYLQFSRQMRRFCA